jgi:hypothetical protein
MCLVSLKPIHQGPPFSPSGTRAHVTPLYWVLRILVHVMRLYVRKCLLGFQHSPIFLWGFISPKTPNISTHFDWTLDYFATSAEKTFSLNRVLRTMQDISVTVNIKYFDVFDGVLFFSVSKTFGLIAYDIYI